MNCYEHTLIAKQDTPNNQLKELISKYQKLISENSGKVLKTEEWGLMSFSRKIKNSNKGYYVHFKIQGEGKLVGVLEKTEKLDNQLLRFLTVRVKKFDLETNYFSKENDEKK